MPNLEAYCDYFKTIHPDSDITPELLTLFAYFARNKPEVTAKNAVGASINHLQKIQRYINAARREDSNIHIDIMMMDIYKCISENFKKKPNEYRLKLSTIMLRNMRANQNKFTYRAINRKTLTVIFCYLAHTQPALNSDAAIQQVRIIHDSIGGYLTCNTMLPVMKVNLKFVQLCLWMREYFPNIDEAVAIRQIKKIASSAVYRRISQSFPPSYPFYSMEFTTTIYGEATLRILPRTYLTMPLLEPLTTGEDTEIDRSYNNPYNIVMRFYLLYDIENSNTVLDKVHWFFEKIENDVPLPTDKSIDIFHAFKVQVVTAAHEFCQHYEQGFPGPRSTQLDFKPPIFEKYSRLKSDMYHAICIKEPILLQEKLTAGASPNLSHRKRLMMNLVVDQIKDYTVWLFLGKPSERLLKKLYTPNTEYIVIIAKESDIYKLYWRVGENIESIQIEGEDTFLFKMIIPTFQSGVGGPRVAQSMEDRIELADIVRTYLKDTKDYTVKLWLAEPDKRDLEEHLPLVNQDTVIIAKKSNTYKLYWRIGENIESIQIEGKDTFLFKVIMTTFAREREDERISVAQYIDDQIALADIVRPYLKDTLEKRRMKDADLLLMMATSLMEYGADPGRRVIRSNHSEGMTAIEQIICRSAFVGLNDFINQNLLQELIRLTLRFDGGRSHVAYIPECHRNKFLNKFILVGQRALANENNMPQELTYTLVKEDENLALDILNDQSQKLRLKVFSLEEFKRCHQERQQVIELCKEDSSFPWKRTMTEEEFEQYINYKLKPLEADAKGKSSADETIVDLIDLLYNEKGQIVCFSISRTVVYKDKDKPSQYHIRLIAIDRSIRDQFPKIAFRLFFYRSVLLKLYYDKNVTTSFTSASAASYLLLCGIKNYPKYTKMLEDEDWQEISTYFLAARLPNPECQSRCRHFTSKLFYEMPSTLTIKVDSENETSDIPLTRAGISLEFYNYFLNILDHSTLVVIHSDDETLIMLNQKIPSTVKNPLTFFAKEAAPLNAVYLPRPTGVNTSITFLPAQDETCSPPLVGSSRGLSIQYEASP